jgi:hypothetical protein
MYATYRRAKGPGFEFDPAWRTSDAVALARGIVAERAFDRMPILCDALQDAGFSDLELIAHLQTDAGEWCSSDWVLWNLLGYGD